MEGDGTMGVGMTKWRGGLMDWDFRGMGPEAVVKVLQVRPQVP